MNSVTKRYLASLAERVVATFVLAYLGVAGLGAVDADSGSVGTVSQLSQVLAWNEKALMAGVVAVLVLLKGVAAKAVGNHNTPSALPASLDPATPPVAQP